MMYCFLKTKSCEDRRNKGLTGYNNKIWAPAAPTMAMNSNILTCNNPGNQARSAGGGGQTVLSCIANMSRSKSVGRSRKSGERREPIDMSSPKMVRKRKMQEEKLKKELLKIDEKIAKKSTKKKVNGRRSGPIEKQNYRIIVN